MNVPSCGLTVLEPVHAVLERKLKTGYDCSTWNSEVGAFKAVMPSAAAQLGRDNIGARVGGLFVCLEIGNYR